MNDNNAQGGGKIINEDGSDVLDPAKALAEQTLAVDLERIQLDQAIATAHRFPRSPDVVIKKVTTFALYNEESAENCLYSLPRGTKPIIGPSVGYATIVQQAWGNCRVGARITYVDRREKVVIAEGAFLDLETNSQTIVPVRRRIVDKHGRIFNDDMIGVTGMAAASIARRNAIFAGVPRVVWYPIWQEALGVVRGNVSTFAEKKEKAIKAMSQFGVKPEQLFMALGLKGEADLTLEHIPHLRGMYASLKSGEITVEEMFDPRRMTGKGFEQVENPLGSEGGSGGIVETAADTQDGSDAPDAEAGQQEAAAAPKTTEKPAAETAKPAAATAAQTAQPAQAAETTGKAAAEPAGDQSEMKLGGKPEASKTAEASDEPKSAEEYVTWWEGFCKAATSATAVQQKHASNRSLRDRLQPFSEPMFDRMEAAKTEAIERLKKKG